MSSRRQVLSALTALVLLSDGKYSMKASDTVGKETDDDLFISSNKTVKVGTVASPGVITKTIRIPAHEFVPYLTTANWEYTSSHVRPSSTAATSFFAPIVLPKGCTITQVLVRWFKQAHPADSIDGVFMQVVSDGASTLATLTTTSTGWHNTSAALSQLVGNESYVAQVNMDANSSNLDVRLQYFEITYTMPSYDKGY
jgi:hypothetical protein